MAVHSTVRERQAPDRSSTSGAYLRRRESLGSQALACGGFVSAGGEPEFVVTGGRIAIHGSRYVGRIIGRVGRSARRAALATQVTYSSSSADAGAREKVLSWRPPCRRPWAHVSGRFSPITTGLDHRAPTAPFATYARRVTAARSCSVQLNSRSCSVSAADSRFGRTSCLRLSDGSRSTAAVRCLSGTST